MTHDRVRPLLPLVAVAALLASAVRAEPTLPTYHQLARHHFGTPAPIRAEGLEWSIDASSWRLEHGSVRVQEAVDGRVTGLWFEGRGEMRLPIADATEMRQLRRLIGDPSLSELTTTFDRMLLRASGGPPLAALPPPTAGSPLSPARRALDAYFVS